jgi:hypothetical protein
MENMKRTALSVAFVLVASAAMTQSTNPSNPDWVPIDPDPNTRSAGEAVELAGARVLAMRADRNGQLEAVRIMSGLLDEGSIRADDADAVEIVRYVLGSGVTIVNPAGGSDFPLVRIEAVRLLARLAGPDAREVLYEVIRRDHEPAVVAEAVRAIAAMNAPPEELFYDIMTARIRTMNHGEPDDRLAFTILESVLTMHGSAWQVEDPDLYEGIIGIARGEYVARVRRKAVEVLETLREGD